MCSKLFYKFYLKGYSTLIFVASCIERRAKAITMFFRRKHKLSDSSLITTFVALFAELVRRELLRKIGLLPAQPVRKIRLDLPFSRADGCDYLRIVEFWNNYRKSTNVKLPSRAYVQLVTQTQADFFLKATTNTPITRGKSAELGSCL